MINLPVNSGLGSCIKIILPAGVFRPYGILCEIIVWKLGIAIGTFIISPGLTAGGYFFGDDLIKIYDDFIQIIQNMSNVALILDMIKKEFLSFMDDLTWQNGGLYAGHAAGGAMFEIALFVVTGGVKGAVALVEKSVRTGTKALAAVRSVAKDGFGRIKKGTSHFYHCKILKEGCFVAGTPVLMAPGTISGSGIVYALSASAMMPVPVQDVPLLGYVLANRTVATQTQPLLASNTTIQDVFEWDPFISAQQRERDRYEINNTDWYGVSFEQVEGTSKCQLALHKDWINQRGYSVDAIVQMSLPEQGISGPYRITSIKHILPQKIPESDPGDDYEWKSVTGLFIHESNQVYNITFDNGDTLGVTTTHPIFSTTDNNWRLAGELKIGDKVLTFDGEATVTSIAEENAPQEVYNLEIKDLHNFLVGESGVVVHNGCGWLSNFIKFSEHQIKTHYARPNHATAFGLPPNYNTVNGNKWKQIIKDFVGSDGKRHFPDLNYRNQFNGILVMDESSGLMVLMKADGEFVTAYKLGANQISSIINDNFLF